MSNQLQVKSGGNVEGGLNVTGGLIVDALTVNGNSIGGTVSVSAPITGNGTPGSPLAVSPATTSTPGSLAAADKIKLNNSGTSGSATTASPVTTLSIDVSADGDGTYEIEFEGTILSSGGFVFLKLQANGADLPSAVGNYKTFLVGGGIGSAGTQAGYVAQGQNFVTNDHLTVYGRFSWRAGKQGGWATQYSTNSDSANESGDSVGNYTAGGAALSTLALTATAANGIVSGTFYVRKIMS